MKRWRGILLRVCVCVLLGAIVNVAVAWGFALRMPALPVSGAVVTVENDSALLMIQKRRGDTRITIQGTQQASIPSLREISRAEFNAMLPNGSVFGDMQWIDNELSATRPVVGDSLLMEHAHGWPMLAMSGWASVTRPVQGLSTIVMNGLWEIGPLRLGPYSTVPTYRRLLPLHPLWIGFAINTVFYAAVFWAIFAVPIALRRRVRIKRGLCANCGYDLRGRSVEATRCTECGQPVR